MSGLFDLDAPIWVWMGEVADVIILSMLWWLCCCGIITVGASTTAVFYVLGKKVRKEQTYVVADFFKSFKQNLKQSIPLSMIYIVAAVSCGLYGILVVDGFLNPERSSMLKFVIPLAVLIGFEFLNYSTYVWAVFSRFDMKTRALCKTAFIMTHKHLLTTLMNTVIYGVAVALIIRFPFLIVVAPGLIILGQSFLMQNLFAHYITSDEASNSVDEASTSVEA